MIKAPRTPSTAANAFTEVGGFVKTGSEVGVEASTLCKTGIVAPLETWAWGSRLSLKSKDESLRSNARWCMVGIVTKERKEGRVKRPPSEGEKERDRAESYLPECHAMYVFDLRQPPSRLWCDGRCFFWVRLEIGGVFHESSGASDIDIKGLDSKRSGTLKWPLTLERLSRLDQNKPQFCKCNPDGSPTPVQPMPWVFLVSFQH